MKVYITFEKDGFGEQIEKVFNDESDAQDHIINTRFGLNEAYCNFSTHELQETALGQIEEHDVTIKERR